MNDNLSLNFDKKNSLLSYFSEVKSEHDTNQVT